jgi:hypothetical protein
MTSGSSTRAETGGLLILRAGISELDVASVDLALGRLVALFLLER